jgi:hypothetical protein
MSRDWIIMKTLKDMELKISGIWNKNPLMSMPDALPMEIALIAPILFKFQVYSTFFCHYYNRPITLPPLQLLHQSTIHHMALINAL